jgi:hypothetical protein
MTEQEIQKLISREVIGYIPDKTIQSVIRAIIFNPKNKINWDQALKSAYEYMPELES